jgi:signal transduction histidine kinase
MVATATRQRFHLAEVVAELEATRAESARSSREAGVAAERERLAHEIHDTLAQGFTSIVALAQAVQAELDTNPAAACRHVELIGSTARENLAEARVMVAGLTPAALDEDSLAAAIRRLCDRFTAETGITVRMSADSGPVLGMATDVVLLRATQEALANVRKHSRATDVHVQLVTTADHIRLSLQDNGIELDEDHIEGFGLRRMRSRVAQVGGAMSVSRTPGGGLTVTIEMVPA